MRRTLIALTLGLGLIASAGHAQTADAKATVDAAKVAGVVGEQGDGFLGLVAGSAPPNVQAAVAEINAGREKAYADISAKTGVPESDRASATGPHPSRPVLQAPGRRLDKEVSQPR